MMWMCVHCFLSDRTCAVRVLLLYLTVCSQLHCAVSGQSPSNLALNKWTKQSSTYGDYDASKAVDGIIKGPMAFSLTRESPNQWWRVDLGQPSYISRVVLYNRGEAFNGRLAKVSLLVSQSAFTDPSVSSSEWTRVFYRERSFGDVGYINLISLIARHVSVFCGASNGLILREVEIYGSVAENFALKGVASQSTTSDNKFASLAVDGDISTSYASAGAGEHWWNVTLSGAVFTSSVVIYKPETAINSWLVSTTRPQHDPILCSRDTGNTSVIYISCPAFTLAKGLVIKSVGEAGAVVLSEVQVYGFLAPVLNPLMITPQEPGYTSIQFSFRAWNPSLPEHVPPDSYLVYVRQNISGSTALNQSVNHTPGVFKLDVAFNDLVHSTVYEVMISCVVNGTEIQIEDTTDVKYLSTRNCSAPVLQTMKIELTRYTNTSTNLTRFRMEVASAVVEVGCVSLLQHTVTLSGAPEKTIATVDTNNISGEFVNLDPYTNYTVTAVAMNSGDLSSKDERTIQTDVTEPGDAPGNFLMRAINNSCLMMNWNHPLLANGPLHYFEFNCTFNADHISNQTSAQDNNYTLCGLPSATRISCELQAVNSAGKGPYNSSHTYTHLKALMFPDLCSEDCDDLENSPPHFVLLSVRLENAKAETYRVIIKEEGGNDSRVRREAITTVIDVNTLFNYTEAKKHNLSYYVTAEINASLITNSYRFPIGDGKTYGGYFNAPLEEGKNYTVWYGVTVHIDKSFVVLEMNSKGSRPFTARRSTPTPPLPATVPPLAASTDVIVGSVVAVITVIAVVIIVVVCLRHNSSLKRLFYQSQSSNNRVEGNDIAMDGRTARVYVPGPAVKPRPPDSAETRIKLVTADYGTYANLEVPDESEAIPIDRIEWYMQTNEQVIEAQFMKLGQLPPGEMTVAALPENHGKSRYKGLYPVDEHRVILDRPTSEGTDYINASHIKGYNGRNQYIAAQGPTDATINDFWLMIWQQHPSAIVMVTNIREDGKLKCNQYWPERSAASLQFGDVTVKTISEDKWCDFTIRDISMSKNDKERMVKQYHYQSWPDHGVPKETNPFLNFYHRVKESIASKTEPLLVHCSAGVGRTGTYLALDYLLDQAAAEGVIDPYRCVKVMRERRPNLVQAKEQYVFLHKVLLEALVTKHFTCSPSQLEERLGSHSSGVSSIVHKEFEHIEKLVKENELTFDNGRSAENLSKNRFPHIIASDGHRPYINGEMGDYINAVIINGTRERNSLVATQLPLADTVADFWQLVVDHNIGSIVELETGDVDHFPELEGSSRQYSTIQLLCSKVIIKDEFTIRHIEVTTKKVRMVIYLFTLKTSSWQDSKTTTQQLLLNLYDQVETWQQQTGNQRILVSCIDGVSRCGLFVCGLNLLSNFKVEQRVDVYTYVLLARLRRPEFIHTFDQYLFLYNMLVSFRDSFSTYANFQ